MNSLKVEIKKKKPISFLLLASMSKENVFNSGWIATCIFNKHVVIIYLNRNKTFSLGRDEQEMNQVEVKFTNVKTERCTGKAEAQRRWWSVSLGWRVVVVVGWIGEITWKLGLEWLRAIYTVETVWINAWYHKTIRQVQGPTRSSTWVLCK